MNPESLWADFIENFKVYLKSASADVFADAWSTHARRTDFYRTVALQHVAKAMGYEFESELFKVDFAMWTRAESQKVPVIFIESENAATTATHEIQKLCCIAAPLRVLITVVEWDESKGVWGSGGYRTRLLTEWQSIIRAHNLVWPRTGLIGVVVGEWRRDDVLRFYSNAIDPRGSLLTPDKDDIVFERKLPKPPWHDQSLSSDDPSQLS